MQRIIREISAAIGLADTIAIVRRWGGRSLYVPVRVQAGDALALTLGLEKAQKLVAAFGGTYLELPAERNAMIELRNALIVEGLRAGRSQESLGLEFGLSRQMIGKISIAARERGAFSGNGEGAEAAKSQTTAAHAAAALTTH